MGKVRDMILKERRQVRFFDDIEASYRRWVDEMEGVLAGRCERCARKGIDKPSLELIPADVLLKVGKVFGFGERKYGRDNWKEVYKKEDFYGSLQRHLNRYWNGEEYDGESGLHHLSHALCRLMMIVHKEVNEEVEEK